LDLDVGKRPTPIVVDWNNDGMLDIVSGAWDGYIHVFYNGGCGGSVPPRFTTTFTPVGLIVQENGRDRMVPSTRSSPVVMDFDGDGRKDLLTGSTDGTILLYKNTGTDSLPVFSGYSLVRSTSQPIALPGNQRSRPFLP
jgi:WD40 repeat protein